MFSHDEPFVAVVTGSASGIGQAIAIELASRGCRLILNTRSNVDGLMRTAQACQSSICREQTVSQKPSRRPLCIVADLRSKPSLYSLADAAFAQHGYVNLWVHAAGADVLTGPAKSWSFEQKLSELWDLDVRAMMLLSRTVAERQVRQSCSHPTLPSMIHIGWDQATQGMEGDSGQYFCAIKSAVSAFSKSLAKTYAPRLRVNCISPGWIQTEWGRGTSQAWAQRACKESLLERWGRPEDIAKVVAAISLGDGEFINAQDLAVNGGWRGASEVVASQTTQDDRS
jgi:3-oxoacyl-[acyl-carrier protein] reductase